jgi:hypothetical protein
VAESRHAHDLAMDANVGLDLVCVGEDGAAGGLKRANGFGESCVTAAESSVIDRQLWGKVVCKYRTEPSTVEAFAHTHDAAHSTWVRGSAVGPPNSLSLTCAARAHVPKPTRRDACTFTPLKAA